MVTLHFFLVYPRPKEVLTQWPAITKGALYGLPLLAMTGFVICELGIWWPTESDDLSRMLGWLRWLRNGIYAYLLIAAGYFGAAPGRRDEAMAALQLEPLLRTRMGALSKGQRKRAVLGLGWIAPQPLLLADEPFDGLDLRQTREVSDSLRRHARGGRTLLLSIHQIGDAARVCDRFVLLGGGRVTGQGTLDELCAQGQVPVTGSPRDLEEAVLALT